MERLTVGILLRELTRLTVEDPALLDVSIATYDEYRFRELENHVIVSTAGRLADHIGFQTIKEFTYWSSEDVAKLKRQVIVIGFPMPKVR